MYREAQIGLVAKTPISQDIRRAHRKAVARGDADDGDRRGKMNSGNGATSPAHLLIEWLSTVTGLLELLEITRHMLVARRCRREAFRERIA